MIIIVNKKHFYKNLSQDKNKKPGNSEEEYRILNAAKSSFKLHRYM